MNYFRAILMKNHLAQHIYILILICCFWSNTNTAQDKFYLVDTVDFPRMDESDRLLIDTTLLEYHQEQIDTQRLNLINDIVNHCYDDKVWPLYNQVLKQESYQLIAQPQYYSSDWIKKAVSMYALSLNNEGFMSYNLGDFESALLSFQNSLDLREKIEDTAGIGECYNNLGGIHYSIGNYDKAIENFKRSLSLKDPIKNPVGYATALNNIGGVFNSWEQYDSAFAYYEKSLRIYEDQDDREGIALGYHNMASIQSVRGEIELAHLFFLKSIRINESLNDLSMVANSYCRLSDMYLSLKDYEKAELFGQRALIAAEDLGYPELVMDASEILYKVQKSQGKFVSALQLHEQYLEMKDSVQNIQTIQEVASKQLTYEFDKKSYADSVKYAEEKRTSQALIAEKDAKIDRDFILQISMIVGILLLIVISILIFKALKSSKKYTAEIARQKTEIEEQAAATEEARQIVSVKNKEILDSINYAQRLQFAILPSEEAIQSVFKEQHILYLPKDIVAGDFYWMKELDDQVYFAVADCTGHGVPGAFVSLLCSNALDKAILDLGKASPAAILETVTNIITEHFSKSELSIQDGMDIALCKLDKKTLQLEYAGANNPLWLVSKEFNSTSEALTFGDNEMKLFEVKANKQPVGIYPYKKPFQNHIIQLQENDLIFMSSDGFADQFGGPKGKKLKYKKVKEQLLAHHNKPIQNQITQLHTFFEKWRGDLEQVDDICIWMIAAKTN